MFSTGVILTGLRSVNHKPTSPLPNRKIWRGKGLVIVDRGQNLSVSLITFSIWRHNVELDKKWKLSGHRQVSVSRSEPMVGESA